jgi:hypothetical protein
MSVHACELPDANLSACFYEQGDKIGRTIRPDENLTSMDQRAVQSTPQLAKAGGAARVTREEHPL